MQNNTTEFTSLHELNVDEGVECRQPNGQNKSRLGISAIHKKGRMGISRVHPYAEGHKTIQIVTSANEIDNPADSASLVLHWWKSRQDFDSPAYTSQPALTCNGSVIRSLQQCNLQFRTSK